MKKYLLFFLLLIPLLGCQAVFDSAHTPMPVVTNAPSIAAPTTVMFTSTLTSTPQPLLKEHEWVPKNVLLRLDFTRGDNSGILTPPSPPHFILYADGNMFLQYPLTGGKPYRDQQMVSRKLEHKEMCKILNTLDQTGFLDYDPSDYQFIGGKPNTNGAAGAYIEVNAWKSHKKEYPELPLYILEELTGEIASNLTKNGGNINDRNGFPVISPALRSAYYLLVDYPEDGFEVYQPENLAVWIRPLDPKNFTNIQWEDWRLSALSIANMFARMNAGDADFNKRYLTLRGQEARALYGFLNESFFTKYYVETNKFGEKKYYAFHARPLLPYELPGTYDMETPAPMPTPADFKLKCSPSDGVMSIPDPRLIFNLPTP